MPSKRLLSVCCGMFLLTVSSATHVLAQPPSMVPPGLQRQPRTPDEAAYRQIQIQRAIEQQQQNIMRSGESIARQRNNRGEAPLPITKAERKRFEELMEPEAEDVERYKSLLDRSRTGIFKLFPNSDCSVTGVVRADGRCASYVPGGSSNRFRSGAKTPDIHFIDGRLVAQGFFSQQLLVKLGDVPIESVTLATPGIAFLNTFAPATDPEGARAQFIAISDGITEGGFSYSNREAAAVDMTYAVRIVAYRNTNNLLSRWGEIGSALNEDGQGFRLIQKDERTDVTVAFRVIRRDEDGVITIVWRELTRQKSPQINFDKNERMGDFRH